MVAVSAVCRRTPYCCAVSSHDSLRPPSLSAMMEHTFTPIMPDCHGWLFCFAVEKSVPPRGDQIPVVGFQTTAPPSRVNFREIRGPGVSTSKMEKSPENRIRCGNIAACSRLSGLFSLFFSFLSFKTALIFPKGVRGEKSFRIFLFSGVRNSKLFCLLPEGSNNALLAKLEK